MDFDGIYRNLRKIQLKEKKTRLLTKINYSYYSDIIMFQRDNDEISDKEIQNLKNIALKIYFLREKKIILMALSKVRGGIPILKHMLDIEKKLYDSTFEIIIRSRKDSFYDDLED